jgi:hypothetical protein
MADIAGSQAQGSTRVHTAVRTNAELADARGTQRTIFGEVHDLAYTISGRAGCCFILGQPPKLVIACQEGQRVIGTIIPWEKQQAALKICSQLLTQLAHCADLSNVHRQDGHHDPHS